MTTALQPRKADRLERANERAMPWSDDAEQAVLGALLLDAEAVAKARTIVTPDDFFRTGHQHLFRALLTLADRGEVPDIVTVAAECEHTGTLDAVGGRPYLGQLLEAVPTTANIEAHARTVRQFAERRAAIRLCEETAAALRQTTEPVAAVTAALQQDLVPFQVASATARGFVAVKEVMWPLMERLEAGYNGAGAADTIPIGYPAFDEAFGGIRRGEVIFLGAVPGGLKTAFALNVAQNLALGQAWTRDGQCVDAPHGPVGVGIVSAEMRRAQLVERMLARQGPVSAIKFRMPKRLEDGDFPRLARAAGTLGTAPLWIDDTPRPLVRDIMAKARALKAAHPEIALLVVDFVQLLQRGMSPREADNRALELSNICYDLAGLCAELGVAGIVLCQVDAAAVEQRANKRPQLGDLRWSQAMREAGHFVGLCYREAMYRPPVLTDGRPTDVLEISWPKARDAEPTVTEFEWVGKHMTVQPRRASTSPSAGRPASQELFDA